MTSRAIGTKVHTVIKSGDPVALLPLQEALGYDLAQSLFAQQRNLVVEGITDYWYLDSVAQLLHDGQIVSLNDKIALIHAGSAGKVVYYATILHAHKLKVAALLDSDTAGDQAAKQDELVNALGNRKILRTKDYYSGPVSHVEVEDLLRGTLVSIAKSDLGWDVSAQAAAQPKRPLIELMASTASNFSKYKLAKAFIRWTRNHTADDLQVHERDQWRALIEAVNKCLG
jgi:predicted ATP-dependent endonuclease of OLD family